VTFAKQMAAVRRDVIPGRYDVDVSSDWNCPMVPQGGLMAAVAAKAMILELAGAEEGDAADVGDLGDLRLRSLTTMFAAQVADGPVTIDVRVLRRGRSMSQLMAMVRNPGAEAGHTTIAVFGRPRRGYTFTDIAMPDVPVASDCPSFRDPPPEGWEQQRPTFPFWEMVEGRPALGRAPWEDYTPTTSDSALWYRLDELPTRPDGTVDPLALLVYGDTMPGSVGQKIGNDGAFWIPPSADLTVHLFAEQRSEWVLGHARARQANDGYASLEMALWDPAVGLLAFATQMMYFVFPEETDLPS
jgi:acyl-CoA thioesterase